MTEEEGMGTEGEPGLPLWALPLVLVAMVAIWVGLALVISGTRGWCP